MIIGKHCLKTSKMVHSCIHTFICPTDIWEDVSYVRYLSFNPQVLRISSPFGRWQEGDGSGKQRPLFKLHEGPRPTLEDHRRLPGEENMEKKM